MPCLSHILQRDVSSTFVCLAAGTVVELDFVSDLTYVGVEGPVAIAERRDECLRFITIKNSHMNDIRRVKSLIFKLVTDAADNNKAI